MIPEQKLTRVGNSFWIRDKGHKPVDLWMVKSDIFVFIYFIYLQPQENSSALFALFMVYKYSKTWDVETK